MNFSLKIIQLDYDVDWVSKL